MRIPLLTVVAALALGATAAHAQDSTRVVSGRVVDDRTGQPIPMAAVHMGNRVADSDSTGAFRLCRLPADAKVTGVVARGYETGEFSVTVSDGDSADLHIRLPAGGPKVIRMGHGIGPDGHRAIIVVDGERIFYDPSGCRTPGPGERTLDELNPNDIESVEVLKGPPAVARFGNDAPYGAILITMKKPGSGESR